MLMAVISGQGAPRNVEVCQALAMPPGKAHAPEICDQIETRKLQMAQLLAVPNQTQGSIVPDPGTVADIQSSEVRGCFAEILDELIRDVRRLGDLEVAQCRTTLMRLVTPHHGLLDERSHRFVGQVPRLGKFQGGEPVRFLEKPPQTLVRKVRGAAEACMTQVEEAAKPSKRLVRELNAAREVQILDAFARLGHGHHGMVSDPNAVFQAERHQRLMEATGGDSPQGSISEFVAVLETERGERRQRADAAHCSVRYSITASKVQGPNSATTRGS